MSLVDGPTGRELANEELADPVYADAQPSVVVRVLEWLAEQLGELLEQAGDLPGGQWLLAAGGAALMGSVVWLVVRWRRRPGTIGSRIFETDGRPSAASFYAQANHHYQAKDWDSALIAATRATVISLQDRAMVPVGPGVTITEVRESVADPAVHNVLATFESVRYGGRACTEADAQSAIRLADPRNSAAKVRP
jgi:hypothetical protein